MSTNTQFKEKTFVPVTLDDPRAQKVIDQYNERKANSVREYNEIHRKVFKLEDFKKTINIYLKFTVSAHDLKEINEINEEEASSFPSDKTLRHVAVFEEKDIDSWGIPQRVIYDQVLDQLEKVSRQTPDGEYLVEASFNVK